MGLSHRWLPAVALVMAFAADVGPAAAADSAPWVAVASSSDARADYARGFGDAINGRIVRERDDDYRAGYRAGRAKRESNESRADGRDYARGYTDGFNHFRERKAVSSSNRAYAAGYRAGQAEHTKLAEAAAAEAVAGRPLPAAASVDALVGRPSARLDEDMKQLGFVRMGQFKQGKETFTTWLNRNQSRCVRVMSKDNKVQQLTDVDYDLCN
jgi:hypothetical protein